MLTIVVAVAPGTEEAPELEPAEAEALAPTPVEIGATALELLP